MGVGGTGQRRLYWSRQDGGVEQVETEDGGEVGRFGIEFEGRLFIGFNLHGSSVRQGLLYPFGRWRN